ncbi:MAG TPA: flagellar M-ring protein FliF C-terminal domain-containing protein [Lachnospiraceae bacterium]|nr:flagellar M-ring protein FliF C-terminal domain-containing protein [Lachnospiraceae bacterium]
MLDRLREIPQRLLDWWNKFNSKQKTIIISVIAGVALTLAILVTLLMQPQYETLITCESTKEASEIIDLLEADEIPYDVTDDGLIISVEKKDISAATLLLGANSYPADAYSIEDALAGGFSTTEADKTKRYQKHRESLMEEQLETQEAIDSALVTFYIPDNDGTLLAKEEESYATVYLELNTELGVGVADNYARAIATALGNDTTDNVTILDFNGNLLFSGSEAAEAGSNSVNASNQIALKQEAERLVKQEVIQVMLGTNLFEDVKVAPNLIMDFSSTNHVNHNYTPAEGQSQGVLSHEDTYAAEGSGGTGGVPGTDTNTENEYVIQDDANSNYTVEEESRDYLPNEEIIDRTVPPGAIQYDESSVAVTASHFVIYKEEELRAQGLLDGITFEEFEAANSEKVRREVDAELVTMVANATGIPESSISIIAYDVPMFQEREGSAIGVTDVVQILLIVLILGLLGFVVFSGMRKDKKEEPQEEELSVETLLTSTQEHTSVEDIDLEAKSETRKMIEKFVDENPEAVASLLRNWLNEEWG